MTYISARRKVTTMTQSATAKSERVNLRLGAKAKKRIERAASFEGKTVSSFILSSALSQAEQTIRRHETMALGKRDAAVFFEALANPPKMNAKLAKALEDHGRRVVPR